MARGFVDQRVSVADILNSTAKSGRVRLKLGDARSDTGFVDDVAMWGQDGFLGRPNDKDETGAAQAFYLLDGYEGRALQVRDNRYAEKAGALEPGDRAIVSNTPARFLLKREQDLVSLYTEGTDGAQMVVLDGQNGVNDLVCGGTRIHMTKDSIILQAGGTQVVIDADGFSIAGKHFACNTGSGRLGTVAGAVPAGPALSILLGPAGPAGVPSATWLVSP